MPRVAMQSNDRQEALDILFNTEEWGELIKIEQELRDECIWKMVNVPVSDPNYATLVANLKGQVEGIVAVWKRRNEIRNDGKGKVKPIKGGRRANQKTTQEADEFEQGLDEEY